MIFLVWWSFVKRLTISLKDQKKRKDVFWCFRWYDWEIDSGGSWEKRIKVDFLIRTYLERVKKDKLGEVFILEKTGIYGGSDTKKVKTNSSQNLLIKRTRYYLQNEFQIENYWVFWAMCNKSEKNLMIARKLFELAASLSSKTLYLKNWRSSKKHGKEEIFLSTPLENNSDSRITPGCSHR